MDDFTYTKFPEPPSRDSLVYLIEVSGRMLESRDDLGGENCVQVALTAASQMIRTQMIVAPLNSVAVVLYGVKNQQNGCYELQTLNQQTTESVKRIIRFVEKKSKTFDEIIQQDETPQGYLHEALNLAIRYFSEDKVRSTRRIVLVTDTDNPGGGDEKLQKVIKTRCGDLVERNIYINPIFIGYPENPFNVSRFWGDVPMVPQADTSLVALTHEVRLEEVEPKAVSDVVIAMHKSRRALFRNFLILEPDLTIQVQGYSLYASRPRPVHQTIFSQGDQQVLAETITKYFSPETAKEIPKDQIKLAFRLGKEYVPIAKSQQNKLRDFGPPGIRILGFCNPASLSLIGSISHPFFLYPSDLALKGSVSAFKALWASMLKENKVAVADAILRENSPPKRVMLYATEEELYKDSPLQKTPAGIHMVVMPYKDDIRMSPNDVPRIGNNGSAGASDAAVELMSSIIDKLEMKRGFNPRRYSNPQQDWFDEVLEATALSIKMPKKQPDSVLPKYNSIQARAGSLIKQLNDLMDDETETLEPPKKRVKGDEH